MLKSKIVQIELEMPLCLFQELMWSLCKLTEQKGYIDITITCDHQTNHVLKGITIPCFFYICDLHCRIPSSKRNTNNTYRATLNDRIIIFFCNCHGHCNMLGLPLSRSRAKLQKLYDSYRQVSYNVRKEKCTMTKSLLLRSFFLLLLRCSGLS